MSSVDRDSDGPRYSILVVDDEPGILELFERMLHRHYRYVGVSTTPAAEEAFDRETFDMVIVDQRLADGTGTSLLARFAEKNRLCRRIALSGYSSHGDLLAAINVAGVTRFLLKPVTQGSLLPILEEVFREYDAEREGLRQLFLDHYGEDAKHHIRPTTRTADSTVASRIRPATWPKGPTLATMDEADAMALAGLLAPDLDVGLVAIGPPQELAEADELSWSAEMERRLVSLVRETDQVFRLPNARFVLALAHADAAGTERVCERLAENLNPRFDSHVSVWSGDADSNATTFAQEFLARVKA